MSAIAANRSPDLNDDPTFWPGFARRVRDWLGQQRCSPRDAIVVLPQAALLPCARQALSQLGGWQPRVETMASLAAAVAPPVGLSPARPSFDETIDTLVAAQMLRRQVGSAPWSQRDPRALTQAATAVARTARDLALAAFEQSPSLRDAWWQAAREHLSPVSGPGGSERLLARVALEWAAMAEAPATDALFRLEPSAWIGVRVAGASAAIESLLAAVSQPSLLVDADEALLNRAVLAAPKRQSCAGFEDEAMAAAAAVLRHIAAGQTPIALVSQDRLLVRRTRALLEREGVRLTDETGWKLSTTRAAARVMALLRAADPRASADARLDWLKADPLGTAHAPGQAGVPSEALAQLESAWRRGTAEAQQPRAAQALWAAAEERLAPLRGLGHRPTLARWLAALAVAVVAGPHDTSLRDDDAGRQVLATLRLHGAADAAWHAVAEETRQDLAEFTAWVDNALEAATYLPPPDESAEVVVTPLTRTPLRPFAAAVFPGTDDKRFGSAAPPHVLLPDAVVRALGLDDAQRRRERERLAFAHLLHLPHVTLLRRLSEGSETLASSPLVERAAMAAAAAGQPWPREAPAPVLTRVIDVQATARPMPSAAGRVPTRLTASAVGALRDCPYRFFARSILRLGEITELESEVDKRDYGSWLHAVLLRFHETRPSPGTPEDELARLHAAADAVQAEQRLDDAQMLPFRAGFASFAPRYVDWLQARDAEGWAWAEGEVSRRVVPAELGGTVLEGRIDRIDHGPAGRQLNDYKTGSADELKRQVRDPLEDTQLPFYAALEADAKQPLQAIYLALDDREGPKPIPHDDVAESAARLVEGLAQDLAGMRRGAGLPALGEGRVCDTCEARGLCRRDHWTKST